MPNFDYALRTVKIATSGSRCVFVHSDLTFRKKLVAFGQSRDTLIEAVVLYRLHKWNGSKSNGAAIGFVRSNLIKVRVSSARARAGQRLRVEKREVMIAC